MGIHLQIVTPKRIAEPVAFFFLHLLCLKTIDMFYVRLLLNDDNYHKNYVKKVM